MESDSKPQKIGCYCRSILLRWLCSKDGTTKKDFFSGARVHYEFVIKLLVTVTGEGKERKTAVLLR